ncbi:hypothetical protein BaRGS_00000996 [Batillaria attramentaria]|uniref:Uncharacterized protein n=1 Tax=Batillaria attramentaria TaxID=370345 RepID=A0ABD0M9B9_9CAEN
MNVYAESFFSHEDKLMYIFANVSAVAGVVKLINLDSFRVCFLASATQRTQLLPLASSAALMQDLQSRTGQPSLSKIFNLTGSISTARGED